MTPDGVPTGPAPIAPSPNPAPPVLIAAVAYKESTAETGPVETASSGNEVGVANSR